MNYLAHHVVARRAEPTGSPAFFVGNLLPDLLAVSGDGRRLRAAHLAGQTGDVARGARFHLATDRLFHGSPAFAEASTAAKSALLSAAFSAPLHRVFFLAHVMVEIALDAYVLRNGPAPADDLYAQVAACDRSKVCAEAARFLGREPTTLSGLEQTLLWFGTHRYLYSYATPEGQAEALYRIGSRVGLSSFEMADDRARLARVFETFTPGMQRWETDLLGADSAVGVHGTIAAGMPRADAA